MSNSRERKKKRGIRVLRHTLPVSAHGPRDGTAQLKAEGSALAQMILEIGISNIRASCGVTGISWWRLRRPSSTNDVSNDVRWNASAELQARKFNFSFFLDSRF